MAIRLQKEEDLLDINYRKRVIKDILGEENQKRKDCMYMRHDLYRDNARKYVSEAIVRELGQSALNDMSERISNLSILKAIINKKAMVYGNGVKREVLDNPDQQEQLDKIIEELEFNSLMKKANRWEELFKNAIIQVYPYQEDISGKWCIKLELCLPYNIDIIEDEYNNECGRVYIYSYYAANARQGMTYARPGEAGIHTSATDLSMSFRTGDGIDQTIADSPADKYKKEYVWWSSLYHFTTDEKGVIIKGDELTNYANPIKTIPFINLSTSQDGNFWAVGGEDLAHGSVLINLFLTEIYYIAKYQGMGLFYFFGRGVPKNIKVGPSQAITLDVKAGDPTPQVGFATSNPNLAEYMMAIKEYVSALLKTNGLEPAAIIGTDSAVSASSGIQELIKKSELSEVIEDQKEYYRDKEPEIIEKYIKWHNYLYDKNLLEDSLMEIGRVDEEIEVITKFNEPRTTLSEMEKLDIIQRRKELGLDTMVDSIMRDNPDMSREEAEQKYELLQEEKISNAKGTMNMMRGLGSQQQMPLRPVKETNPQYQDDEEEMNTGV